MICKGIREVAKRDNAVSDFPTVLFGRILSSCDSRLNFFPCFEKTEVFETRVVGYK